MLFKKFNYLIEIFKNIDFSHKKIRISRFTNDGWLFLFIKNQNSNSQYMKKFKNDVKNCDKFISHY